MQPMSKDDYDQEQAVVREVYDPLSGRMRLVKGSGEVIERIVSHTDHRHINARATAGDGSAFLHGIYQQVRKNASKK